jgi:RNA polymerase sigma factor (sigma-70 family)
MAIGENERFERLFRAEHRTLVAFCYRRVDDVELAQDLAAEVFRVAWSRRSEPRSSDRGWLFGIARNLVGDEYRRRAVRSSSGQSSPAEDTPDPRAANESVHVEVRATIAGLAAGQAEVLRLSYWDGLSAGEIAEALGLTTAAVWMRLTRARAAFATAWRSDHHTAPTPLLRSQP